MQTEYSRIYPGNSQSGVTISSQKRAVDFPDPKYLQTGLYGLTDTWSAAATRQGH